MPRIDNDSMVVSNGFYLVFNCMSIMNFTVYHFTLAPRKVKDKNLILLR